MSALAAKSVSVIVVAAGEGRRMGAALRKPWLEVAGAPVVVHTLRRFAALDVTRELILVVHPEDMERARALTAEFPALKAVAGGAHRVASVRAGLEAAAPDAELVAIQDGVRPLVDAALILRVCEAAAAHGAAIPVVPVRATLKQAPSEGALIARTVPRDGLYEAQTPQVFRAELIREAYAALTDEAVTDDAQAVELLGRPVATVPGSVHNIKITTPDDLKLASVLLSEGPAAR